MKWPAAALFAAVALGGCSKNIKNSEAVRQGVIDYLTARTAETGLNMNMMDVSLSNVEFKDDKATATVAFKPKGAATEGMSMNYVLARRHDKWVVQGRKESGANPHGQGETRALPPDHPAVRPAAPSDGK